MRKIFTILMCVCIATGTFAQWAVMPNAPSFSQRISEINENLYIGANDGVYESTDQGNSWTHLSSVDANASTAYFHIVEAGNYWYLGSSTQGIYRSSDQGQTWQIDTAGLGINNSLAQVRHLYFDGTTIYAAVDVTQQYRADVFYKDPNTSTWTKPTSVAGQDQWGPHFYRIAQYNNQLYATTSRGMFESMDGGDNWIQYSGQPQFTKLPLCVNGSYLYTATGGPFAEVKVHKFDGNSWVDATPPLTSGYYDLTDIVLYSSGSTLYYSAKKGTTTEHYVYKTDDDAATWSAVSDGTDTIVKCKLTSLAVANEELFGVTGACGTGPTSQKGVKFGGTTGINDNQLNDLIRMYPNPANNFVTISNVPKGSKVMVTDFNGKLVYSSETNNEQTTISTANFVNGIYIIQIQSNSAVANKKLVVNR